MFDVQKGIITVKGPGFLKNRFRIIKCDIINPLSDTEAELIRNGAAVLERKSEKEITAENQNDSPVPDALYIFREKGTSELILKKYINQNNIEIIDRSDQLMLPPFYDIHFHWVQDDVRQMPKENLLNWLSDYVWPYESKFIDPEYSEIKCIQFARKLASAGTLGGACYCSIHSHTADHALKYFKGHFAAGNVLMTMNSPEYLIHTEENAVDSVRQNGEKYRGKYAVTPRFAPTVSPAVMKKCSEYAALNNSFIQTHLSETEEEIDFILSLFRKYRGFEKAGNYTEIYRQCGILGPKTIMGHCIHLSDSELAVLGETGTAAAHCPSSNAPVPELGLGSGLFDFRRAEKAAVKWALASDIGGGPYLSMFDVMRSFVHQNRERGIKEATYIKALYRATAAGAEIMGARESKGNILPGKSADFILIGRPDYTENETAESILNAVIEKNAQKRDKYIETVQSTFLGGIEIFKRKNS